MATAAAVHQQAPAGASAAGRRAGARIMLRRPGTPSALSLRGVWAISGKASPRPAAVQEYVLEKKEQKREAEAKKD